jgi:hypothetical protein
VILVFFEVDVASLYASGCADLCLFVDAGGCVGHTAAAAGKILYFRGDKGVSS